MYAAAGTLIAHYQRERTGRGQHVDVSMQASMLWALANAPAYWSLNRENLSRGGNFLVGRSITGARMRALYPCKDGHINFIIYGGEAGKRSNEAMVEWMAETGRAPDYMKRIDWGAFNVATSTQEEIDSIEKPFGEFLRDKTKEEFSNESVKRGILGYPVANAQDIRGDPQLAARDFWQAVPHDGTQITFPGAFAKFSATQVSIRRRAPRIGEHNEEIFVGELGLKLDELKRDGVV
jgi:crotonobetainyl-CoA:carnitine CoA-transferase CaiB-like acyl-CoA transferase